MSSAAHPSKTITQAEGRNERETFSPLDEDMTPRSCMGEGDMLQDIADTSGLVENVLACMTAGQLTQPAPSRLQCRQEPHRHALTPPIDVHMYIYAV